MDNLGSAIRAARIRRGKSLRAVAAAADVSPSLLSQVETGKTHPSVSTLYAIVNVLGISLDEILGVPHEAASTPEPGALRTITANPVQRAKDNPRIEMENGVTWERLAVDGAGMADSLLTTYAPGGSSSIEGKLMRHSGVEYGFLLEGELTLRLDFEEYTLRSGDSLCFDSQRPHLYENRTDAVARGLWVVVGRSRASGAPAGFPINSAVDVLSALGNAPVTREWAGNDKGIATS